MVNAFYLLQELGHYFRHFIFSEPLLKILILTPAFWIEFPWYVLMCLTAVFYRLRLRRARPPEVHPPLGIIVTAFREPPGDILKNLRTLIHQDYPGRIEIVLVFDTRREASIFKGLELPPGRSLRVVTKQYRGGRASSLNLGLKLLSKDIEIVLAVDADTSLDYDALRLLVRPFADPRVVAVSGNIKVRNARESLWTRFQHIEYVISITLARLMLSLLFGTVNNISGAYGAFRRRFLELVYGWDSGTAEDLDLTSRLKIVAATYPGARLAFVPESNARTSVPATLSGLLRQRQRWDGDLVWIFFKKYRRFLVPAFPNWREFFLFLDMNLLLQFVMPVAMLVYNVYLWLNYGLVGLLVVNVFIFVIYVCWTILMYAVYLLTLSQEVSYDLPFLFYTVVYPAYNWLLRVHALKAYLDDWCGDLHKYSSYVPRWVSRKLPF